MVRDTHLYTIGSYFKQHYDGEVVADLDRDEPDIRLTVQPTDKFYFHGTTGEDDRGFMTVNGKTVALSPLEVTNLSGSSEEISVVLTLKNSLPENEHQNILNKVDSKVLGDQ